MRMKTGGNGLGDEVSVGLCERRSVALFVGDEA
jgi:hypothetical protein